MEVAAVACLAFFGMGALGFGYSFKEIKKAHSKALWTDPRCVAPLVESTARKFTLCNTTMGKGKTPVMHLVDTSGRIVFLFEHAGFCSTVWFLKDATTLAKLATMHVSPMGTYFVCETTTAPQKVVCSSREAGRYREFVEVRNGVSLVYRWYSQSYHLERVVTQAATQNGASQDEEVTVVHEIVGNCHRVNTRPVSFELNIDCQRVNVISGIASWFICMMTEWRKVKKIKS